MNPIKHLSIYLVFCVSTMSWLGAQDRDEQIRVRYIDSELNIDGHADEAEWSQAIEISNFTQWRPTDSLPASYPTRVKALYNDQYLYLLVVSEIASKNIVVPSLQRDYEGYGNDNITFTLDTFNDKTNGFFFGTNPYGVKREALLSNGANNYDRDANNSWDTKWEVGSQLTDTAYINEIRIPFARLNYPQGSQEWGFNLYRYDTQSEEWTSWAKVPQNQSIVALAFTQPMIFEKPLGKNNAPWAAIPYLNTVAAKDFEEDRKDNSIKFGGDFKIPIGNGLNLDLTLNPDFSQVEVDDQIINLTRFEVSLPEKRQFFIQNSDLFTNFGDRREAQPFFSRRIGVAEDRDGNNIQNRIIGGLRLSGKLNDKLRVGLMNMTTDEDPENGIASFNNSVLTLQQQVFSRSNIGLIFINREELNEQYDGANIQNYNRVFGLDYNLASANNQWTGRAYAHTSSVRNGGNDDWSTGAFVDYNSRFYGFRVGGIYVGDDFQSDLGFIRRTGIFKQTTTFTRRWYPEDSPVVNYQLRLMSFLFSQSERPDKLSDRTNIVRFSINKRNQSSWEFELRNQYVYLFDSFDPTRTDQTPLPGEMGYTFSRGGVSYRSDPIRLVSFNSELSVGEFYNGYRYSLRNNITLRKQPYLRASLLLNFDRIALPEPYATKNLWLISPKIEATLSKSIFWTTFVQYSSQSDNLGINSRLQWRFAPLSDLYLVYNDQYYDIDNPQASFRSINLKLTYWFNF
ncbi:MAG: DUF5916 domain-containing protein [Flavobacteriaceae bacterium]